MNARRFLLGILVIGLIVRLATMLLLQTWDFPSERVFAYEEGEIGYALANGQGFSWPQMGRPVGPSGSMIKPDHPQPTAWRAPINPAILAVAFWLFGSYSVQSAIALESFQILLSLLSCYVLFRLGKMLFNEWTGLVAALIFALYPAAIHFSVRRIEYGSLLTLLGLLLVQQTIVVSKRPSMTGNLALGALAGIAALVNPVVLAFCPFALLWLLWTSQKEWRPRLTSAATIVGCCGLVLAPWLVRNYLVFDRIIFIKSNFSREFVMSNFREDGRTLNNNSAATPNGNDGKVSTTLFNQKALSLLLEKPIDFLRNTAIRLPRYWTHVGEAEGSIRLVAGIAYYSVLCFGLAGMWTTRSHPQAQLLLVYVLTMPVPYYLTYARLGRFRFPIEPVLILFASYAVTSLLARLLQRKPGFDGRLAAILN